MADSNSPDDPIVDRLVVKKDGKALIVHTLIGDVHIKEETIQASKRKVWRPLSIVGFLSGQLERDLTLNYPAHLLLELHRTFRDAGYTRFTGLIRIPNRVLDGTEHTVIELTTHRADYVGSMRNLMKRRWDENLDQRALMDEMNDTLLNLQNTWDVNVRLIPDKDFVAYDFVYDPDGRSIFVGPHERVSTSPNEYPNKAGTTSELLMLLTGIARCSAVLVDNIDTVLQSYPLAKLFVEVMDTKTFDFGRVQVNAADLEEWDYINPAFDGEFDQVSRK